jgi:hypothetical protein
MKFWIVAIMIILVMSLFAQCIPPDNTYEIFVIDRFQSVTSATDIEEPSPGITDMRGVLAFVCTSDYFESRKMV